MWRSIFLPVYFVYLLAGVGFNLTNFLQDPEHAGWLASTLCHLIAIGWFTYLRKGALTNSPLVAIMVTASSGAALLIAAGYTVIVDASGETGMYTAMVAFLFWLVYHVGYLKYGAYRGPLQAKQQLPEVLKEAGISVTGKRQWVIFHSGEWNAFARFQLKQLSQASSHFAKHDVGIIVASTADTLEREGVEVVHFNSAKALDAAGIPNSKSLPVGVKGGSDGRIIPEPFALLVNADGSIEHVHKARDMRRLPSSVYFLRFLEA